MLFAKQKNQLGIDIGTSNIKLVELKSTEGSFELETYGIASVAYNLSGKDSKTAIEQTAAALRELIKRSGVTTNRAVASLPNNAVFTSVIELPRIPDNELKKAIEFEAKKYVPLPLEEVALSWSALADKKDKITKDSSLGRPREEKQKILLTAVPTIVIDNYVKMFQMAEIEALALIRSIIGNDTDAILLIDIGAKSTSVNIVDNNYLRVSKSLSVGGDTITNSLAQSLSVNFARAEQFKKDFGMTAAGQQIPQVIRPVLDMIKNEAAQLIGLFESHGERMNKIVFSGAGAKLPGLADYFASLGKPIELANPWSKIKYPADLKPVINPLGINLAISIGLAMRPS
jgi:type IV pilus assembly protein PilM